MFPDIPGLEALQNVKKIDKLGVKTRTVPPYNLPQLKKQTSDDDIDSITFEKCRLSLKSPTSPNTDVTNNNNNDETDNSNKEPTNETAEMSDNPSDIEINTDSRRNSDEDNNSIEQVKSVIDLGPDIVRGVTNYTETDQAAHKAKLGELQLKQKLMEEQNKRRKEMLAKALADRYFIFCLFLSLWIPIPFPIPIFR